MIDDHPLKTDLDRRSQTRMKYEIVFCPISDRETIMYTYCWPTVSLYTQ